MKNFFTLIELIISVIVIGILAAIVIPNISSMKEEAIKTEVIANTKNLQTVTEMYALKNNGKVPTKVEPTFGNPTRIDLAELFPKYIKTREFKHGYYWLDNQGKVWGATIDAPIGLTYQDDTVSFEAVNKAVEYELFGYGESTGQKTVTFKTLKSLFSTPKAFAFDKQRNQTLRFLEHILLDKPLKIITKKLPIKKQSEGYLVSAVDKFGLQTAPVGKMYDGYDSIFPISQSFSLITNANGEADWLGLYTVEDKPAGTEINYTFETSNNGKDYTPVVGDILDVPNSQYLKVKVEMKDFKGVYPTIHKLKVQFTLGENEQVEVDIENDMVHFEGVRKTPDGIVLADGSTKGVTEHVIKLPSEQFFEDVVVAGNTPHSGSIETSYQSSKDGVTWSDVTLKPEELPAGSYIKIINVIKRDNVSVPSPTIEKIIVKTTDKNPNVGAVTPISKEEIEETKPTPKPEEEWESILNFNIIEDATKEGDWISVDVVEELQEGTRIVYEYYTSSDELNWTKYDKVAETPNSRFFKVAVKFERLKGNTTSPKLIEMTINYKEQNGTINNSVKYKDGVEYQEPSSQLNQLEIGQYIRYGKHSGYDINWQVVAKKKGEVMLFMSDPLKKYGGERYTTYFDAKPNAAEPRDSARTNYGSNNWAYSDLRIWLNNTFYNNAFANKDHIAETTHDYILADIDKAQAVKGTELHIPNIKFKDSVTNYDTAYRNTVTDKVYMVNLKELVEYIEPAIGSTYANQNYFYYLRDSSAGSSSSIRTVSFYDNSSQTVSQSNGVVRAAMNIKSADFISGAGTKSNPYIMK